MIKRVYVFIFLFLFFCSCKKNDNDSNSGTAQPTLKTFNFEGLKVNGNYTGFTYYITDFKPLLKFSFSEPLNRATVSNALSIKDNSGSSVLFNATYEKNDSTLVIEPSSNLSPISRYSVTVSTALTSTKESKLLNGVTVTLMTGIDSTDKFSRISDTALIELIQRQTFNYFWNFAHPVSGLARERNSSGDIVTTGGSGFGIMAIITAVNRNFINRSDGLARMQTIVDFLKNKADKFHGAFPHWLNGATGKVVPFSTKDNGADLVETSYLMQGLLCARQFFNGNDPSETALRNDINDLWKSVEWSWFRKNNDNVLYWHWSPDYNWDMNMPIHGWNECLITYVLAASSPTFSIPATVYNNGWAQNGQIKNGNYYYGLQLPLGPAYGGPLFFSHYSFLGINPFNLSDAFANYQTQTVNQAKINYAYCRNNPKGFFGYSDQCWGLTASDIPGGYTASSPANDVGVIAPTAALSSFPYTPEESMQALKFYYYKLGDKLWGPYGFYDAFSLHDQWFANSYLAIDQGPIIVMIENYRSGLLWNLFMSCPEIKNGMHALGFQSPNL